MLRAPCRLIRPSTLLPRYSLPLRCLHNSPSFRAPLEPAETKCATVEDKRPKLRGYQEECIATVLTALREGRRKVGVSLATGSGKTVIFTELIDRVAPPKRDATQTLILVHRRELVEQAARHCSERYPDKTVDIEMGPSHASGVADITIASVQSLNSKDRIDKFNPDRFKLVLVDEAHHIVASGYLRILEHFGLQSQTENATPALVGVSATFSRFDGQALGKAIKHIVYHKDYIDLIGEKWLSDVVFTTVKTNANLSKVGKNAAGDFATAALSEAVNTNETNLLTVRAWLSRAQERKSTIVFCVDLKHVSSLTNTFRAHGIDARFVTGDTHKNVRGERVQAFKDREFPVLLNCGVFTEGTDIPNIDCVLLARPTRSRNLLVQMIGRGMRLYTGKENCHVIDMVTALQTGVVTTPTLFGLDPSELVSEANADDMRKVKERKEREKLREDRVQHAHGDPSVMSQSLTGNVTFTDYDSVSDLIDDTSGERYIRAISPNAWVGVNEDKFVLVNGAGGSYLTIEHSEEDARLVKVTLVQKNKAWDATKSGSPFYRPRLIAQAETFESAVRAADTYAKEAFTHPFISIRTRAGEWRKALATQQQVDFLNKFRDANEQLLVEDVTKGQAGDMITKIKFGARGKAKRFAVAKRKVEKREQGWARQQAREDVQVGPLDQTVLKREEHWN